MKKKFFVFVSLIFVMLGSCKRIEDSCLKYENDQFSIEYPKTWEIEVNSHPFRPFTATTDASDVMFVAIGTRLKEISLDSFVEERIDFYKKAQWGFRLLEKDVKEDVAVLRYLNEFDNDTIGTTMKIMVHGNYFYGIDSPYRTKAEKDTVEYIINSLKFK